MSMFITKCVTSMLRLILSTTLGYLRFIFIQYILISLDVLECTCCPIREVRGFEGEWISVWTGRSIV